MTFLSYRCMVLARKEVCGMASNSRRKKGTGTVIYDDTNPNRKSKWRAHIRLNGKPITRFFPTEREAKAFLRDIVANDGKAKEIIKNGVNYGAYADIFLEEKKKQSLKPKSYDTLAFNVERTLPFLGAMKLNDIDSATVQNMIDALAADGYSQSILEKSKIVVGSILKKAAANHLIDAVPVFDVTIPRAKKQDQDRHAKDNWLRATELAAYEAECVRTYIPQKYTKYAGQTLMVHPSAYRLLFLVHTGLRVGEALALTWEDYDDYSKTLMIDKNMVYASTGKLFQDSAKTEAGERLIVLNKQAVEDLSKLREIFDAQTVLIERRKAEELREAERQYSAVALKAEKQRIKEKYAEILREHKYICGATSFPYASSDHSSTSQTHHKICKAIGLKHHVTVHGLRHTYVTHYYLHHKNDADFDLATFSKSIGHSSIRTTMEIYAHLDMVENRHIKRDFADLKDF